MGKYGLSGNSGFVSSELHIARSYDSNGKVFVETNDEEYGVWWERVDEDKAKKEDLPIISCSMCEKICCLSRSSLATL